MLKKLMFASVLCAAFAMGATSAQAVTIDLSSPQEGQVLHPGDAVEATVTVTNDTASKDVIHVTFTATALGYPVTGQAKIRLKLAAGESVTRTIGAVIPADLQLPGPVEVTITGVAVGKISGTQASDSISATVAP
jgi:hypothetical protein